MIDGRTGEIIISAQGSSFPAITAQSDGSIIVQPDGNGGSITLLGHSAPAKITQDFGRFVATASVDGTARIHIIRLDELIGEVQSRLSRQLSCDERVRYLSEKLDCAAAPTATPTK